MMLLTDGDSLVYAAARAAQKKNKETGELIIEPVHFAYANAKRMIQTILEETNPSDFRFFLTQASDTESFRLKLYPEYKANRIKIEKPYYYHQVREYYINHWKAEVVGKIEADDAVSIEQCFYYKNEFLNCSFLNNDFKQLKDREGELGYPKHTPSCIAGIDKDLDNTPGLHYNYQKKTWYYLSELECLKKFYLQICTGDKSDNIPRIQKKWRSKQVEHKINKSTSEEEIRNIVLQEFEKIHGENAEKEIQLRGELLWLMRKPEDYWSWYEI